MRGDPIQREPVLDRLPGGGAVVSLAAIFLASVFLAVALRRLLPASTGSVVLAAAVMSVGIFGATWFLAQSGRYSRAVFWGAAAILAAGLFAPILFMKDSAYWARQIPQLGMYDVLYVILWATAPRGNAGWCSSSSAFLIGAAIYSAAVSISGAMGSVWHS